MPDVRSIPAHRIFSWVLRRNFSLYSSILSRSLFRNLLEDPAEVRHLSVAAVRGHFLQRESVVPQHELGAIDADQVQIIIKAHQALLPEQAGDVVRSQSEMFGDALSSKGEL